MSFIFDDDMDQELLNSLFSSDDKCLDYLASIKWETGFICRKCGNNNFCPGKVPYSRRCTRCKNEESATANTIFHNCKFEISKAFYITYKICRGDKNISSNDFAQELSLRQITCWKFSNKIQKALDGLSLLNENEKHTFKEIILGKDKYSEKLNSL